MYYFDSPMQLALIIIPMILVGITQIRVKSAYNNFKQKSNFANLTGREVAERMLRDSGINDVTVTKVNGELSDHYNPRTKTIGLSPVIYDTQSIAGMAVAAHEVGHAIQHNEGYVGIKARDAILPACNIGSNLGMVAIMIGLAANIAMFFWVGIISLALILAFQLITLPVEFNASKRALEYLETNIGVSENVRSGCKSMLTAAALTYVAAVMSTLLTIIRLILQYNSNNNRRRR